jgi:hypothetical protein
MINNERLVRFLCKYNAAEKYMRECQTYGTEFGSAVSISSSFVWSNSVDKSAYWVDLDDKWENNVYSNTDELYVNTVEGTVIEIIDPDIDKLYEVKKILKDAGVDWKASIGINLESIKFTIIK